MAQKTKKAKLAHEKRTGPKVDSGATFGVTKVIELVTDKGGKSGAIVELDDSGTMGIVDSGYVTKDRAGNLVPRMISCPATYDPVARDHAVARYSAHAG